MKNKHTFNFAKSASTQDWSWQNETKHLSHFGSAFVLKPNILTHNNLFQWCHVCFTDWLLKNTKHWHSTGSTAALSYIL